MLVLMPVHHPHPEHREALIASMHRYGAAIAGKPGLVSVHTLSNAGPARLVGMAIFESEADYEALAPLARAAVAHDPFAVWEKVPIDGLRLNEV